MALAAGRRAPTLYDRAVRRLGFAQGLIPIVALALLLRVLLVVLSPHFVPKTDAADYDRMAVSLAQHGTFPGSLITRGATAFRPPLFPAALAAVYKPVGVGVAATRWEAGRLLEAAFGAIAVGLVGLLALRLWGRRAGLVAAAIAAVFPPLVLVGSSLMSESLFIPLVLAAVLSALKSREATHRLRWAVLAGLLVGLGALARGNGVLLVIPTAFLVWSERPRLRRSSLKAPALVVLAMLVTLAPWSVRNALQFHQFVPITTETGYATDGTYNALAAHRSDFPALWGVPVADIERIVAQHPGINEAQLSDRLNSLAAHYVEAHPAYVLKVLWWSSLRVLNLTGAHYEHWAAQFESYPPWLAGVSVYAFWVVGLVALGGVLTAAARRVPLALWCCPAVILLPAVFLQGATRYRSPADPFVILLAALALLAAWDRFALKRERTVAPGMRVPSAAA